MPLRRFMIVTCLLGIAQMAGAGRPCAANVAEASSAARDSDDASYGAAPPWASVVQIGAPSVNTSSPGLLDRADFPLLWGLALDHRLEGGLNRQAYTLSATPLGIAWLARRASGLNPDLGRPDDLSRRAAVRITLGGPPQFIHAPSTVHDVRVTTHVTSELKLRLSEPGPATGEPSRHSTTLALALTADNLSTRFGLDRYQAMLIAERQAPCTWTANAGYRIVERYRSAERLAEAKMGLGAQYCWVPGARRKAGLDVGLSGACLLRNQGRSAVWQMGANAQAPIVGGLRLSAAARRSDRPEIPGDDRMRSVLSLAYAFGSSP